MHVAPAAQATPCAKHSAPSGAPAVQVPSVSDPSFFAQERPGAQIVGAWAASGSGGP